MYCILNSHFKIFAKLRIMPVNAGFSGKNCCVDRPCRISENMPRSLALQVNMAFFKTTVESTVNSEFITL